MVDIIHSESAPSIGKEYLHRFLKLLFLHSTFLIGTCELLEFGGDYFIILKTVLVSFIFAALSSSAVLFPIHICLSFLFFFFFWGSF